LYVRCDISNEENVVSVEPVSDSSRYFVLRLEAPGSKGIVMQAIFIELNRLFQDESCLWGLDFRYFYDFATSEGVIFIIQSREEAFDFKVALRELERYIY